MKNKNVTIYSILLIFIAFIVTACGTLSPFESGVITGEAAQQVFDSEKDEERFKSIKHDIELFLASGRTLTQGVIDNYVSKLSKDFSPAFVQIVVNRLGRELGSGDSEYIDDARAREFLTGLAATIRD